MLKIQNVTKYYGEFKAVDNLSFEVRKGEIFGLLGVNGAGKTTTFRMIMNLLEPTSGSITLEGAKITYDQTDDIGFLTEERSLLTKLTVREQAEFYGRLKGMTAKDINRELEILLNKFEVPEYIDKKIKELSKGNQQKIQFITAIMHKPKLLILDEPFAGLDPINVKMFKKEIVELRDRGTTIIFSSHRMDHVEEFCEKVLVLLRGKAIIKGYLKDIKEEYGKKNIFIVGDVLKKDLEKIKGVIKVYKHADRFEVKIENKNQVKNVFDYVSKCSNITRFEVDEPSLDEIFVERAGEKYEK